MRIVVMQPEMVASFQAAKDEISNQETHEVRAVYLSSRLVSRVMFTWQAGEKVCVGFVRAKDSSDQTKCLRRVGYWF
jgi:hypothetical protein